MNSATLYLPYLPNLWWFSNFLKHETVIIEREEKFVKSSFRNRCIISGANGIQILSIPVIGGRDHQQFYKEVEISNHYYWHNKHWKSILSAYGSTPYFGYYADRLEPLYKKTQLSLFEFNHELLKTLLLLLKVNKEFTFTSVYDKNPADTLDLRSVKSTEEQLHTQRYYQVFENKNGFIANLSIIDLLFHLGPKSKDYLLSLK